MSNTTPLSSVFKAYDVRATYPQPLDESLGFKIGWGVGQWMKQQYGQGDIAISHDHRPMAPQMTEALIAGIHASGMNTLTIGRADTSIQYFAIGHLGCVGGVQCTASHNPIAYIGYKISGQGGIPVGKESGLDAICQLGETAPATDAPSTGKSRQVDIWDAYREHVLSFLGDLPRPVKIFVDASNGCGTALLERVFSKVNNLQISAINNTWTDTWAHEPNPMLAEGIDPTREGVVSGGFDLGAAFDGDADRCMLVDETGNAVACDHLTAALAGEFLAQSPGAGVGYDLRSSKAVEEAIRQAGGIPHISKVGHVNIKALLRETGAVFAGELSGHFYFRDNACCDSGAITLATVAGLISRSGKPLSQLIKPHLKYPHSGEINFKCEDKDAVLEALKTDYASQGNVFELDGISCDAWDTNGFWFNIRASNTEPLLRLNAEAKTPEGLNSLLSALKPRLGSEHHGH